MKKITNATKHKQQVLDDLMLESGQSAVLTFEQQRRLSKDIYYEALVKAEDIREEILPDPEPASEPETRRSKRAS